MKIEKNSRIVFGTGEKPEKVVAEFHKLNDNARSIMFYELKGDNKYGENANMKDFVTLYDTELIFCTKQSLTAFIEFLQGIESRWE